MKNRTKIMNTDIVSVMKGIVDSHMQYYQSDFAYDIKTMTEAALSPERTDRIYIWLCRTHGTWLLKEKSVFIRDSHAHSVCTYYEGQTGVLAFVVEVNQSDNGIITGDLYNVGYKELCERVKTAAVAAGNTLIRYEDGQRQKLRFTAFDTRPDKDLGQLV